MKLQVREILRAANRMGIRMQRGCPRQCALAVPARSVGFYEAPSPNNLDGLTELANKLGVSTASLEALEYGFEQTNFANHSRNLEGLKKHRSYKVGQNIAAKLGYKPDCSDDERHNKVGGC